MQYAADTAGETLRRFKMIRSTLPENVTLVCASKAVPLDRIIELYASTGHLDFGENYVQYTKNTKELRELEEKAEKCEIPVKWHYIGKLQKSTINRLLRIKGLYMI